MVTTRLCSPARSLSCVDTFVQRGRGDLLSRVSVMRNPASFFALQPAKLWMQSAVAVVMFLLQPNSTVGVGGSTFTVEIGGSIQVFFLERTVNTW